MTRNASPAPAQESPAQATELLTVARRATPYRVDGDAKRGPTGEGSFVTRGAHVKTGAPYLVHCDGSAQSGLPLGVVGAAILHGVISDEEIDYLRSLRK